MTTRRSDKPKVRRHKQPTTAATQRSSAADLRKHLEQRKRELAHTQELLTEALQQQTATADVLKVISRSKFDLQPVLDALLASACGLCEANIGTIRYREGSDYRLATTFGCKPEWIGHLAQQSGQPDRGSIFGRTIVGGRIVHLPDVVADPDFKRQDAQKLIGFRAALGVPLVRDGQTFGVISLLRFAVGSFSDKQIELIQTFAAQAVIAIENVRLFNEVEAKTRDLSEALTYQTGSSNILRVIASSPTDLGPVLQAIVESACELCEADDALVHLRDGDNLRYRAHYGPIHVTFQNRPVNPISRNWVTGRSVVDKVPIHLHDVLSAEGTEFPEGQRISRLNGTRTLLSMPLLRENESVGAIVLRRTEVKPFSDKQIALLQTFADQAVIAIGNVRLFVEVQAKTRDLEESLQQQTATADVLKVISRSAFDLQAVLSTLVSSAARLCDADMAFIMRREGDLYRAGAAVGFSEEYVHFLEEHPIVPDRGTITGRAVLERRTVQIADVSADHEYTLGESTLLAGQRTALGVPLLRENEPIGAVVIARRRVQAFTDKQVELVTSFADQAVIAIENARLFNEVQQRTRELSKSLEDLRTAQDRLIQTEKLASLGQLTAGVAHEIKNPLNFVNNFAALSAELTDELRDALNPAVLGETLRAEIDELTGTLKDNLEKVVQHGKRADSIVKNMLLHSREGSGEHRSAAINGIVEESLNLAYHGARAEKSGFKITLQRDLDPDAGAVEVYPQEITRALLNLISNGFYAAIKRKSEGADETFEPVLSAATKNLGNRVEIRIRDNGTGIPPGVKIFNPFFTTKPAGEGTGLGLSMSHDIIVKQHGGTIDLETEPGLFTEFIITLPRDDRAAVYEKSE